MLISFFEVFINLWFLYRAAVRIYREVWFISKSIVKMSQWYQGLLKKMFIKLFFFCTFSYIFSVINTAIPPFCGKLFNDSDVICTDLNKSYRNKCIPAQVIIDDILLEYKEQPYWKRIVLLQLKLQKLFKEGIIPFYDIELVALDEIIVESLNAVVKKYKRLGDLSILYSEADKALLQIIVLHKVISERMEYLPDQWICSPHKYFKLLSFQIFPLITSSVVSQLVCEIKFRLKLYTKQSKPYCLIFDCSNKDYIFAIRRFSEFFCLQQNNFLYENLCNLLKHKNSFYGKFLFLD